MTTKTTKVETTEFEDGSAIVETTTTQSDFIEGDSPVETTAELVEELAPENEGVSDAVAIAAIEADAQIQIAEIRAEVEIAHIEAVEEREISWQEQMQELRTNMQELAQQIAGLSAAQVSQSTPAPLMEVTAETVEEVEITNSTPQFTLDPTSETRTEVIQESVEEKPEAMAPRPLRLKRRLI